MSYHTLICRIILCCLFIVQLFWIPSIYAWNQLGHMIVAQIAYDQLTPEVQKKVSRLSHVLGNYFPSNASFVSSAAWADDIKKNGVKAFNNWHFINYRFSYQRIKMPRYIPRENVVWAIQQSKNVITNKTANNFEKSLFLRFLVHFTGDAHQPTQCSNFYSWRFQTGDKGGTLFPINSVYAKNLHQYWDRGLGFLIVDRPSGASGQDVKHMAKLIEQKYPASQFGSKVTQANPQVWARESFGIAKNFAYHRIKPGAQPTETYISKGRDIVQERLALAGYRLANLLDDLFGGQSM